jgi:two-component system sensor histidine kinase MtrB
MTRTETDLRLPCLVHDLNNVFQTLLEAADLLATDPHWTPLSAAIVRSVERGRNLAQAIHSADETSAIFEDILGDSIAFVEDSLIGGRGPRIEFQCEIDSGIVLRRNWAWERVLINLFSNAVRAMSEGGKIRVRATHSAHEIRISVADEGPGIPPAILDHVFEPHVSTRGSGLGLHIVRTIVRQDGGDVFASNRPDGRGAEFTITIPYEPEAARPAHA